MHNETAKQFNNMLVELIRAQYENNKCPLDIFSCYYLQVNICKLINKDKTEDFRSYDIETTPVTQSLIDFFSKYNNELHIIEKWDNVDYRRCHEAKIEFDNLISKELFDEFKKIYNKYILVLKL